MEVRTDMPYDRQALKITFNFIVADTDEIAQTGYKISGATDFDALAALGAVDTTFIQARIVEFENLMDTADLFWGNYSELVSAKVAALSVNGLYLGEAVEAQAGAAFAGAEATNGCAQNSVVLSLRSAFTIGSANYGRMYLPHVAPLRTTTSPYIASSSVSAIATAARVFLDAQNNAFNTGAEPGAISIMSSVGAGFSRAVTRVGVGRVCDTQRRRRNRLTEQYVYEPVTL